jgi:hypothetical protein
MLGPLMMSTPGFGPTNYLLRPVPGLQASLIPFGRTSLFEMVVPKEAPDAPHSTFIGTDGLYRTNDLFEKIDDNGYVYRGRAGDWIKTEAMLIDTKYIFRSFQSLCAHGNVQGH